MSETQVEVPIPSPVAEPTEGQAATSKTGTAPTVTPLPLISSSPANQATAGAAWAASAAIVTIVCWALSTAHLDMPGNVAAALTALIGMGLHYLVITYGMKNTVG